MSLEHVYDSVCLSVCLHNKTKMAENKITKLGTEIVHHNTHLPINIRSKGQGHTVKKFKKAIEWQAWVMQSVECPVSSFSTIETLAKLLEWVKYLQRVNSERGRNLNFRIFVYFTCILCTISVTLSLPSGPNLCAPSSTVKIKGREYSKSRAILVYYLVQQTKTRELWAPK